MLTRTELEDLSRRAAACLPKEVDFSFGELEVSGLPGKLTGRYLGEMLDCWLVDSTEACTEIMVRVLWDQEDKTLDITGSHLRYDGPAGPYSGMQCVISSRYAQRRGDGIFQPCDVQNDPMLAFRIAVLRALLALKEQG